MSNSLSALEQVALLLAISLSDYQRLVAEDAKGYIPAMLAAGACMDTCNLVRVADRLARGINPDDEAQSVNDIAGAQWRDRKLLLYCPFGITLAHLDRLWGHFEEALLMDGLNNFWMYLGPRYQ